MKFFHFHIKKRICMKKGYLQSYIQLIEHGHFDVLHRNLYDWYNPYCFRYHCTFLFLSGNKLKLLYATLENHTKTFPSQNVRLYLLTYITKSFLYTFTILLHNLFIKKCRLSFNTILSYHSVGTTFSIFRLQKQKSTQTEDGLSCKTMAN